MEIQDVRFWALLLYFLGMGLALISGILVKVQSKNYTKSFLIFYLSAALAISVITNNFWCLLILSPVALVYLVTIKGVNYRVSDLSYTYNLVNCLTLAIILYFKVLSLEASLLAFVMLSLFWLSYREIMIIQAVNAKKA